MEWREVKFNPAYQVSEDGQIRSSYKSNKSKTGILRPGKTNVGYIQVILRDEEGYTKGFKVHRLIAEAFIDNPNNLPEVNHIDMDKTNNRVENLEWVSHRDNILKARENKIWAKFKPRVKKENPPVIKEIKEGMRGKKHSESAKQKQSKAKLGDNHPRFKGYYVYDGKEYGSCAELASAIGEYPMKVYRMYKKGLIQFRHV